jgi:hypothetical protein
MAEETAVQSNKATTDGGDNQPEAITEAVEVGGQVALGFAPQSVAPVIAEGVQLEPEIFHLVSALIHLFQKKKSAAPAR